jgi:lysyl-tRNA synthetase class 2
MAKAITVAHTARGTRWRARVPMVLVWYCRIVAAVSIVGAFWPNTGDRINDLPDTVVFSVAFLFGVPSLGFGVLMLMLAAALRRRKRVAWWTLLLEFFLAGPIGWLLYDIQWSDVTSSVLPFVIGAGIQAVLLGVILWARPEFSAKFDSANIGLALRVLGIALALSVVLGTTLVAATDDAPHTDFSDQALYTLKAGMAGTGLWWYDTAVEVPHWVDVTVNLLGSLMILAVACALFAPRRGQVSHRPEDDERLRTLLAENGDRDSLGYFALRRDKSVVWSPSGKAAIAYRPVGGVSLASGDPLGDPEAWPGAIEAWLAEAREHAWVPAVMGAGEDGGTVFARHGLDALELGDEAVVEVDDFTLDGRAMRVVRQAYNRVERAGYRTVIRRHEDVPAAEMAALVAQADHWRDGAVERGFSMALGRLGEPGDGRCVMVECFDGEGDLRALLSLVPWGRKGLSLDLMRRDRDSENGLIEFMVIDLIAAAGARRGGAGSGSRSGLDGDLGGGLDVERISLNFAMFRSIFDRANRLGAGPFLRAARATLMVFSKWWQLESLYRANVKYRPVWEPRYLCFPKARDLPRIMVAAGRAEGFVTVPRPDVRRLLRKRTPVRPGRSQS